MSSRVNTVSKNFNFPGSSEPVEFVTYKNQDGSFRNSEAIFNSLKVCSNTVNDLVLSLIEPDVNKFYNVRILSASNVVILEYDATRDNRPNFETEAITYTFNEEEISSFKDVIVNEITKFLELFADYYGNQQSARAVQTTVVNADLATFLRFGNGAKIRFLEEICSLYIALNGQTYFDVIGHIIMTGAYTYPALFSTTGLYHAANRKLIGKELLYGASRKTFSSVEGGTAKGEIHTKQGLTILHLRQMRLRQRRTPKVDNYEPIHMIEDEEKVVKGHGHTACTSPQPGSSKSHQEKAYERVKNYRILNMKGVERQNELQDKLVVLLSEPEVSGLLNKIKPTNLSSFTSIFQIFEMPIFESLIQELNDVINHDHDKEILKALYETDTFCSAGKRIEAKKYMIPFLSLVEQEITLDNLSDSLVQRFRITSNADEILMDCLSIFIEMIN